MGRNRLKDIFSTNPPLPEIKLLFQNAEAETQKTTPHLHQLLQITILLCKLW